VPKSISFSNVKRLLSSFIKPRTVRARSWPKREARLELECLEERALMSAVPVAPAFSTTAISQTQIQVSWQPVSGATSYVLDVSVNGGAWTQYKENSAGVYTFSNLSRAIPYSFDVAAVNVAGATFGAVESAVTLYNPQTSNKFDPYDPAPTYAPAPNVSLWGQKGPSAFDVAQGYEGDCWLLSSLAEVAARAPQDIENMFHFYGTSVENGATVGLYEVRFFDTNGTAHWITVDSELPSAGAYYDNVQNQLGAQSLWVALAEKAYAEANGLGYLATNTPGVDSYDALDGGDPALALHAITGQVAADVSLTASNLINAWNANDMIVISSDSAPADSRIVPAHAYAVIGFNGSSFEVLNPWGATRNGYASNGDYSLFWAPASYLTQNFNLESISYQAESATLTHANDYDETVVPARQPTHEQKPVTGLESAPNLQISAPASTVNLNEFVSADALNLENGNFAYSIRLN